MSGGHVGRRYLVTGAGSGIGRATARLLAEHGAAVVAADLDADGARATVAGLDEATVVELDVSSRESWEEAARIVADLPGGLHGLVNNAGITRDRSLGKMSDAEWHSVIDVHLRGAWLGAQTLAPVLSEADSPAIVNLSSSGRHGSFGQTNYAAAKAGVVGLTKTLALELARHGVRCNAVAPGAVDTPMLADVPDSVKARWMDSIALGRLGRPEEIAEAIAFLLSPSASYVTAHVLDVNGGETHL